MKFLKPCILILLLIFNNSISAQQRGPLTVIGKIIASDGQILEGAVIREQSAKGTAVSGKDGRFEISINNYPASLIISYTGFKSDTISVDPARKMPLLVALVPNITELAAAVVSTGYQRIPKERATGSFAQLDKTLLDRSISTNVLSRLENNTSGLIFNHDASLGNAANNISIRGQSTLFANTQPLIVIDNFPYEGDINALNPNDLANITVLKDAAAASIWGSRAGNGVIVITTRKGQYKNPVKIDFNANVTIGKTPNLFYQPQISSGEFIDIEKLLFSNGYYSNAEQSPDHQALTPVVAMLIAARDGKITQADADQRINAFKTIDVRNDVSKYLYRNTVNQQYSLNLNGGTDDHRYYISSGYDKNLSSLIGNEFDRFTLNANQTNAFFKHKLELTTGIYITQSTTVTGNNGFDGSSYSGAKTQPYYPYASLADSQGNLLPIIRDYQTDFINTALQQGLLDWSYSPVSEVRVADNRLRSMEYRLNGGLTYTILPELKANLLYQYDQYHTNGRNLQGVDSYYTRNLINQLTSVDANGTLTHPIPLGGILDMNDQTLIAQNFRAQVNYEKGWKRNHLTAIAGYEVKDAHTVATGHRLYGYDNEHAASTVVDYTSFFDRYDYPGASSPIPNFDVVSEQTDRYLSYFGNAAYNYFGRYTFSVSARLDQSNIFGVNTNQKGVPLWSAGLAWNINNENFYHVSWLPYLKLRLTYGYNGNVYKNVSAFTTASYFSSATSTQLPYALIRNPPNPELRWERVKVINLGIDFSLKNDKLTGTIEYYHKTGEDLIGSMPFAPSTGITQFTGNNAGTTGKGIDLTLNSRNINRKFKWTTNLLLSHQVDKVTSYQFSPVALPGIGTPVLGHPIYSLYSYTWAGLDSQTGDPQGKLNGIVSKDYPAIQSAAASGHFEFSGSARPTFFGSLRNNFMIGNLGFSATFSYRFHYYFRDKSVNYTDILTGQGGHTDFNKRWMKPGDELLTSVPSLPSSPNFARDAFYLNSSMLIRKADNIRLQDIRLSYDLDKADMNWFPVRHLQVYLYANNIGIIWKAYKGRLDPDYSTTGYIPPLTIAAGIRADL